MNILTRRAIIISIIILTILIITTTLLGFAFGRSQKKQELQLTPAPTSSLEFQRQRISPQEISQIKRETRSFTPGQSEDFFSLANKLPQKTADFEINYSDLTGKFYVQKKTDQANGKLDDFLAENGLPEIRDDYPHLFEVRDEAPQNSLRRDENSLIQKQEDETERKLKEFEERRKKEVGQQDKDLKLLVDLMKTLLSFDLGTATGEAKPEDVPTGDVSSLDAIFTEAGLKVGAPPVILRTVMSIECGWVLSLSAEKIAAYSQPGGGLQPGDPCYGKNSAGAVGPMQFLTTIWPPYSSAVNRFGGYTHTPSIWNIRDSVYAAADKLRRASLAFSINWNYDHVKRAVICYNAGCGRLDNPPSSTLEYFNRVWEAYSKTL